MLVAAIEAEVATFLERFKDDEMEDGRQRVLRNGHLPARSLQTGVGAVEVIVPRVRDRAKQVRFTSAILPPYQLLTISPSTEAESPIPFAGYPCPLCQQGRLHITAHLAPKRLDGD